MRVIVRASVASVLVCSALALALPACSEAHSPPGGECPMGALVPCVYGTRGGACGDAYVTPECVDGAWACPSGTVHPSECACSGPLCGDADAAVPYDAGFACPSDPSSLEGTPCSVPGTTCGACSDPCGWCNLVSCSASTGRWERLEVAGPPCVDAGPPGFACGPAGLACVRYAEYCAHATSDVAGEPDAWWCGRIPDGCPGEGCDCFTDAWLMCEEDGAGGTFVHYPGG